MPSLKVSRPGWIATGRSAVVVLALILVWGAGFARGEMRDPTRPAQYTAKKVRAHRETRAWHLESILYSARRRNAVINGKTVAAGERIDHARVLRVERTHVVLESRGRQLILRLQPLPRVKQ